MSWSPQMNLFCGIGLVSVEKYRYRYPKKYRYLPIPIPHLYIQFIRWIIPYGKSRADLIKKSLWQKNSPQNMVCIKRTEIRRMPPTWKLFCIKRTSIKRFAPYLMFLMGRACQFWIKQNSSGLKKFTRILQGISSTCLYDWFYHDA